MTRTLATLLPILLAGCPCGPFVQVDCAAPGIDWEVVDGDGAAAQPDAVRTFHDGALIEALTCTDGGTDCTAGQLPVDDVGTWTIEVDAGGATETFEVTLDAADLDPGGCCSGFYQAATIEITPS
jgi:hypothetical protein